MNVYGKRKEHYWRYSLITIILGLGVNSIFKITPFLEVYLEHSPSIYCCVDRCSI